MSLSSRNLQHLLPYKNSDKIRNTRPAVRQQEARLADTHLITRRGRPVKSASEERVALGAARAGEHDRENAELAAVGLLVHKVCLHVIEAAVERVLARRVEVHLRSGCSVNDWSAEHLQWRVVYSNQRILVCADCVPPAT